MRGNKISERLLADWGYEFMRDLRRMDLELDQYLMCALELAGAASLTDSHLFLALYRLNSVLCRRIKLSPADFKQISEIEERAFVLSPGKVPIAPDVNPILRRIFKMAIEDRTNKDTFNTRDFLRALIEQCLDEGNDIVKRPFTADLLAVAFGRSPSAQLSDIPELQRLLASLRMDIEADQDFQYFLALEDNQLIFRIGSVIDDYVQCNKSGLLLPQRAVLSHFKNQLIIFTPDEIEELEGLLNSNIAKEQDFQNFFDNHPHFLRMWDHREVYPHVCLARAEGNLIPDFLLTDRDLQRAAILDLKLPGPKLIARQHNRDRFAAAVMDARAQLLRYRDWFRDAHNRKNLKESVGMEIYEPQMIVVIGRSSEFIDEYDRQHLKADNPDLEVVTYDDILTFANRRRANLPQI